jgi:protein-S-isoprenylcysteine O-methyltransferase Ste14
LKTLFIALRALLYAAGFVLLWVWLAGRVQRYDGHLGFPLPGWLIPVGWVLAVAGAAAVASCLAGFVMRGRGTAAPFDPPRAFVSSGLYRYVRNPMYLGAALVLAGYALIARSPSILMLALALLTAAHLFVALVEERSLERRFGQSYRAYCAATRRWIPRRPKKTP